MKKGDAATTKAYLNSLVLPDPNFWFAEVFEKDLGRESAAEYAEVAPSLPAITRGSVSGFGRSGCDGDHGLSFL